MQSIGMQRYIFLSAWASKNGLTCGKSSFLRMMLLRVDIELLTKMRQIKEEPEKTNVRTHITSEQDRCG